MAAAAAVPHASASASAPATLVPPDEPPLQLQPVLNDPRLADVRAAVANRDARAAAQAMRGAIEKHNPTNYEGPRWHYLLGTLLLEAGDSQAAAQAFDHASVEHWPLTDYARMRAALAYASLNQHAEAIARARSVGANLPISQRARLTLARALDAAGSSDDALAVWRSYLQASERGGAWAEAAVRVADGLLKGKPQPAQAREALDLLQDVSVRAPGSAAATTAAELQQRALGLVTESDRAAALRTSPGQLRLRAQAFRDAGRREQALQLISDCIDALPASEATSQNACEAWMLKAELLEADRSRRAKAADAYEQAVQACEKHKDLLVRALFRGARTCYRTGRASLAVRWYERIEKEFGSNRLADDARLKLALMALDGNDSARFEKLLSTMAADYPDGDMLEDGLFTLALHRMRAGDWSGAREPLERSVAMRPQEKQAWAAGRAKYFLARVAEQTGQPEQANRLLREVVREQPLSFYMAMAHSRLASRSPDEAKTALQDAQGTEPDGPLVEQLPATLRRAAFVRALELLRLGEADEARDEIVTLGLSSSDADALWAVATVYARAGADRLAFRVALMRAQDWNKRYPVGRWRRGWELAYPRPFRDIVAREVGRWGVPEALGYGIMREESAFDEAVVSHANAYGLMQLIPPTAQLVARKLDLSVSTQDLKRPEVNIQLGCKLLGDLRVMFPQAPLLAIPSYNAGAGATKRWLKQGAAEDFDLWVESIPYEETRNYTKRVISSMVTYAYLYEPAAAEQLMRLPLRIRL